MIRCEPQEWRSRWAELSGARWFDFLAGVDRGGSIEIIGRALEVPGGSGSVLLTALPAENATIDSISDLFPGAAWYEREIAEMLGVAFIGLADSRPLLRRSTVGSPPLLRSTVLAARALKPWPGAAEPADDGRRRTGRRSNAPGVPGEWIQGRES